MASELDGVPVFVAVAEEKGFRAAGRRLGVTGSAVSHAVRRLEERLGVTLLQRTTRSVRLTEAGERFYAAVGPLLEDFRDAVAEVGELADTPRGTIRLSAAGTASSFLSGPILAGFLSAYPEVQIELMRGGYGTDIVAEGYDAGIRLGEMIERDMVAVPISGDLRLIVLGSPAYFAEHAKPRHPRDLVRHACINWQASPDASPYRWEFTEDGHDFSVGVNARVLTNDLALMIRLALDGVGLAMAWESRVREHIEARELVAVLEEYSTPFPGFYLYYPNRRHTSPALRALIGYLLEMRRR
jgi:DNA-binding transcriptional LysR family regulator